MSTTQIRYSVTVSVNGTEVGTYEVEAPREGMARTRAMLAYLRASDAGTAPKMESGALVTYVVREV
jgi:hypothetical protein